VYAADHALAPRLADVVLRRTPLSSAGHPGAATLEAAANILAAHLGWSSDRRAAELREVADLLYCWVAEFKSASQQFTQSAIT
jgi:glycerol-3-phosphate dehydrogenase